MKTIKQLEAEIKEDTDIIAKSFIYEHITILKDVLGLIDDLEKSHGKHWFIKELKKRISG